MWKTDISGERSFMVQPALIVRMAKDKTRHMRVRKLIIINIVNVYTLVSRRKIVTSQAALVTDYRGQYQSQVKKSQS